MVPGGDGVEAVNVPAVLLPLRAALPVLTRARAGTDGHRASVFWGAVGVEALHLVARGLLLPGLSAADHDAWRAGPLGAEETERIRHLAAAMPPEAHAVPVDGTGPLRLPDPEGLVRSFLDAVADTLPRSPAAELLTAGPAYASWEPQRSPELREWASDVAAGHDAGVRLSLRIEVRGLSASASSDARPTFRVVPQVHSVSDPALVADTAQVWAGTVGEAFGTRARMDALLSLRRAARAWSSLTPLLSAAVPDAVELTVEEVTELLGAGSEALAGAGVDIHWPRELARDLTERAEVG
ncbi:ATP-dependent helicase, partial [Streptomyces coelicoflavus]